MTRKREPVTVIAAWEGILSRMKQREYANAWDEFEQAAIAASKEPEVDQAKFDIALPIAKKILSAQKAYRNAIRKANNELRDNGLEGRFEGAEDGKPRGYKTNGKVDYNCLTVYGVYKNEYGDDSYVSVKGYDLEDRTDKELAEIAKRIARELVLGSAASFWGYNNVKIYVPYERIYGRNRTRLLDDSRGNKSNIYIHNGYTYQQDRVKGKQQADFIQVQLEYRPYARAEIQKALQKYNEKLDLIESTYDKALIEISNSTDDLQLVRTVLQKYGISELDTTVDKNGAVIPSEPVE
jgi:hypothetical protein